MTALSEGEKALICRALNVVLMAERIETDDDVYTFDDEDRAAMRMLVRDRLTPTNHRQPFDEEPSP